MAKQAIDGKTVNGKGWFGLWSDGTVGWSGPNYFSDGQKHAHDQQVTPGCVEADDTFVLCRVRIEPIRDSLGRLITRRAKTIGVKRADGKVL